MARGEHAISVAVAAIAGEPDGLLDAGIGLRLLALEEGGRSRHQRGVGQVSHLARAQDARSPRTIVAGLAAVSPVALAGEGLVHHAVDRHAAARQPDERAPDGNAGDEGARAIDRIEHPAILGLGILVAELLADHAMGRELAPDQMAHHALAGLVPLGDGIEGAAARLVLEHVMSAEEGQDRPAGLGGELRHEGSEIDRAHAGSPLRRSAAPLF